jgi:L-methionine (R)-S-oxide reductase
MTNTAAQAWLEGFIAEHGGVAGTIHKRVAEAGQDGHLELCAAVRIPPPVVEATRIIPKGKGMAGLAWQRSQPVQTCNLETDNTGDVRPGAKAVNAQAAVALPVADASGLRAVVGIAFMGEREFSERELDQLTKKAAQAPDLG